MLGGQVAGGESLQGELVRRALPARALLLDELLGLREQGSGAVLVHEHVRRLHS